jgi:hypothetical protein
MSDVVKIPDLEPIPDDDTILNAMRGIGREAGAALTRTVWKDGIDIDVPNSSAHSFVRQITEPYRERIAQQDAEIEMLTRERDSSRKASQQFMRQWHRELATVETLKGLLRGWQMVCRAVQIGAEIPRTIEDLSLRTDQQLQPKGEQG